MLATAGSRADQLANSNPLNPKTVKVATLARPTVTVADGAVAVTAEFYGKDSLIPEWYHKPMAMTLRTDDELDRVLTELAEAEGVSKQEVIRRAVLERHGYRVHSARLEDSAARMVERWGDVLDRLGSV